MTQLSVFIDFRNFILGLSNKTRSKTEDNNDSLAKTALYLVKNTSLKDNIKRRLELQQEIGPFTTMRYVTGISVLHREKKKKVKHLHTKRNPIHRICLL